MSTSSVLTGIPSCIPAPSLDVKPDIANQLRSGAPVHLADAGPGRHLSFQYGCRPDIRFLGGLVSHSSVHWQLAGARSRPLTQSTTKPPVISDSTRSTRSTSGRAGSKSVRAKTLISQSVSITLVGVVDMMSNRVSQDLSEASRSEDRRGLASERKSVV